MKDNLNFVEYGNPDGRTVIYFHASLQLHPKYACNWPKNSTPVLTKTKIKHKKSGPWAAFL